MPARSTHIPSPEPGALLTHHQVGDGEHALIVGDSLSGYTQHDGKTVDLTPHVFFFETAEERDRFAETVELEHARRGTHPLQVECRALNDPDEHPNGVADEVLKAHQAAHKALNKKAGL